MRKTLNQALLKAFNRSNLSAYAVGQVTGLAATTITRWKNGESEISLKTAELIADSIHYKLTCSSRRK